MQKVFYNYIVISMDLNLDNYSLLHLEFMKFKCISNLNLKYIHTQIFKYLNIFIF